MQLFVWIIATGWPDGVVTRSISSRGPDSGPSRTTIAKALVPAETLPVRGSTAWVATMPVPASPSGGAVIAPGCNVPVGSRRAAPSGVRCPASCPATSTSGSRSGSDQGIAAIGSSAEVRSSSSASKASPEEPIGNMPLASPTPSTFLPVSFQCT